MLTKTSRAPKHRRAGRFKTLFERLGSFSELEARIAQLPREQDRGDAFEVFAEAYLSTQKLVGAEEVWPNEHVPIAILTKLSLPVSDMGADGVYKTWTGQFNAYQVKFRTGRAALTWQELGTFMGLTEKVGERVLFTNSDDLPALMNERSRFFCIRGSDLDRLTREDFDGIADWLRGAGFTQKRKEPDPHQTEALEAILAGLEEHNRVTTVMACGTGKTLVALWLAERRKAKRVLVLVPSLALIRQTLHEWLKETTWERPRCLAVCSDPTVTRASRAGDSEDDLIVLQSDLDFPVTTDPSEVRSFLLTPGDDVQVTFSTYQSSHVVGEAARATGPFDLGIFDEAHKTAGREGTRLAHALNDRNIAIAKRVFMTATPRHYNIKRRDKQGDKALVYSMDVPAIYGPIIHTLTFAEAARRRIICSYKIVISVVTSDMVNADVLKRGEVIVEGDVIRARTVANQIAIQKACEAHGLKKIFSFHRSVASARNFTGESASSIKVHLTDYDAHHINGAMPTADREKLMRAFREANRAIMSNARCLTEGVDVPVVDMVAFLSPRKSKVDIVQATGRAMRKADGKEKGYVLLPLFLEMAENETVEEALERTDFEETWNVLDAMQEQDAELAQIIREMRVERGRRGGFDDSRLRERVEVLGPELSLDVLRDAISTRLVDQVGVSWDERYGELMRYKDQHGDCKVPAEWPENPQLGGWVRMQRKYHNQGRLPVERKERLDALGFAWDFLDAVWEQRFAELRSYKDQHGDCNVARAWPENPQLSTWVLTQRSYQGTLPIERKERLDALGFEWDPHSSAWDTMYAELQSYKDQHGDCNVPRRSLENPRLGKWVGEQRVLQKEGTLPVERKERLDALGFAWNIFNADAVWEQRFAELRSYKDQHGDCNVARAWPENPRLGSWVGTQRERQDQGRLPVERKERLDALGFEWNILDAVWEQRFAELRSYKDQRGDCNVPKRGLENPRLGSWVANQRSYHNQGRLPVERKERLDALGFAWDSLDAAWEQRFAELRSYKDQHGDCNVPQGWPENPRLGKWVSTQRVLQKEGTLPAERKERLDALGFAWGVHHAVWEQRFAELQSYKDQRGDCNVPGQWPDNPQLGTWVRTQRDCHNQGKLPVERKEQLDALGFEWGDRFDAHGVWEQRFAELQSYKDQHGDCNVPHRWLDNPRLATWVGEQRGRQNKGRLPVERKERLDALGFAWNIFNADAVWEQRFAELQAFRDKHGHCNVPAKWTENPQLARWVSKQRTSKSTARRPARIQRLAGR